MLEIDLSRNPLTGLNLVQLGEPHGQIGPASSGVVAIPLRG